MTDTTDDPGERFHNPKNDEPILAWANRYNIGGSIRELRTMFQDANTWNLSQRIAATRKQAFAEFLEISAIYNIPRSIKEKIELEIKRRIEEKMNAKL